MKNNDFIIPNVPEIKTVSSTLSPKDQTINTTSEDRVSSFNSSGSSSSSPSDLRKRLEDLQSPNEFTLLVDRVATLGRRISRKRELFVRLHGAVNRIEENDEWEEREQRARSEDSSGVLRPKDARARRRARVRLETSSNDDQAMVVSQTGNPIGPSKTIAISTDSDDRSNPGETIANRSARDHNYVQSSIEVSRRQSRPTSLSEPSSTRSAYCNNAAWHDTTFSENVHDFRSSMPRDSASRSAELPSVAPFSFSNVQPKKFGGYRPSSGMILKNLSSDSESESASETNHARSCMIQRVDDATESFELSSPASKSTTLVTGLVKKMPVLSARSDITQSILPNLLPSTRSLQESSIGHPILSQEALRTACIPGQLDRNESSVRFSKVGDVTLNIPARVSFYNEQTTCDEFPTKIPNEAWNIAAQYECDAKEEISQNTLSFLSSRSARNFMPESAEFESTNVYNERINRDLSNNSEKFRQARFEDDEQEKLEDHSAIVPKIHYDDTKDACRFNHSTDQSNVQVHFSENSDRQGGLAAKWDQMTNFYKNETVDKPGLLEEAKANVTEELALWSEISESFESEDHSRSSYRATMCSQKNTSLNRISGNNTDMSDKYEQEMITATNVPTLALNSQDISYSTSAGSRECPAMQSLDPRVLMKALSDVSLKQESASGKRDDVYRFDNDTSAPSNRVPDFSTKGETWRVPRSSESSRKSLTRMPSKIPIRISSSKNTAFTNVNKLSESHNISETLRKIANEEQAQFMDQSELQNKMNKNGTRQQLMINSETCKQYSLQRPRDESVKAAIVEAHSSRFPSNDGIAEYEANNYDQPESSVSLNLPSPRTPFGNEIYDQMDDRLSNNRFNENVFFNEASYSSNRDYAKIDDDVRSKSDRSTSRKSAETVDITSATESPYLCSKYKHDSISRNESSRNRGEVGENGTAWRTEDEYAPINNEEDTENLKNKHHYDSSSNKAEETYPQTKEHFESEVEQVYHWPPSKSQSSQIDLSLEIERIVRKQSRASNDPNFDNSEPGLHQELTEVTETESLTSHVRRTQKICSFASKMTSSTVNLSCEPKRKRKSQERFPFTISEASRAFSTEHVDTSDYQCSDKRSDRINVVDSLSEEKTHQLKMHPSITRLASSGLEDTMTEILCCVAQEQRESSSKSRMRALMRMFSSKLRKISKQRNDNRTVEPTRIIYENRACRMDSKTNSCSSGDSSAEKAHRLNKNNCGTDHPSNSIVDRTESSEAITGKHSYRKYDRDNLWVRDIKDSLSDKKKDGNVTREETEEIDSTRNQYSIFLAKDFQSDKLSKSDNNQNSGNEEQENVPTRSHLLPADGKEKRETISQSGVPKVEETDKDLTGCSCLRLYRSLAPFKHRSSIRERASSSRIKMSSFLLRKRKK